MSAIERIRQLLTENDDLAVRLLEMFENMHREGRDSEEKISFDHSLQEELRIRLASHKLEEAVWDELLTIMAPDELSEETFGYLIKNNISLLSLCHMSLPDKWLVELIPHDEAPLYTLATRYYRSDGYSSLDFTRFYEDFLSHRNDISLHLLELYRNEEKRELLLTLCLNDADFEDKEQLEWHQAADHARRLTNGKDIAVLYSTYGNAGIVLAEIARNPYTPEEILLELRSVQKIPYAREIRINSENTLNLKRSTAPKPIGGV